MTDIYVMDTAFNDVAVIDNYDSFIWTNRYNTPGDFQLTLLNTPEHRDILRSDYYLRIAGEPNLMIIETHEPDTDNDENYIVRGRDLNSILDRRVLTYTHLWGSVVESIGEMIDYAIIFPDNSYRKISNFIWEDPSESRLWDLEFEGEYKLLGVNLLKQIEAFAEEFKFGFRIYMNDSNQFVFSLYDGVDRSYSQSTKPFVVFSPEFDNIYKTKYLEDLSKWRNVALISGEGEDEDTHIVWLGLNAPSGLYRREMYYSSSETSLLEEADPDVEDSEPEYMSEDEYNKLLKNEARPELRKNKVSKIYDGEADLSRSYRYRTDFEEGDVVQFVTKDNVEFRCRVTEFTRSWDESGYEAYPTFEVEDEED